MPGCTFPLSSLFQAFGDVPQDVPVLPFSTESGVNNVDQID
jgi:hypothetical protein